MRLPLVVTVLGYAGLVPFFLAPAWLATEPATFAAGGEDLWLEWCTLLAAFLAGTLWGFALPALQGPAGKAATVVASLLMLLTLGTTALDTVTRLYALGAIYALLLGAEVWRERTLDTLPGYFRLRATLTVGAVVAIGWRLALV